MKTISFWFLMCVHGVYCRELTLEDSKLEEKAGKYTQWADLEAFGAEWAQYGFTSPRWAHIEIQERGDATFEGSKKRHATF